MRTFSVGSVLLVLFASTGCLTVADRDSDGVPFDRLSFYMDAIANPSNEVDVVARLKSGEQSVLLTGDDSLVATYDGVEVVLEHNEGVDWFGSPLHSYSATLTDVDPDGSVLVTLQREEEELEVSTTLPAPFSVTLPDTHTIGESLAVRWDESQEGDLVEIFSDDIEEPCVSLYSTGQLDDSGYYEVPADELYAVPTEGEQCPLLLSVQKERPGTGNEGFDWTQVTGARVVETPIALAPE